MESTNGTQINGISITDAELKDGAEIRFGYVTGVFQDATGRIDQARELQVSGKHDRSAHIRVPGTQSIFCPRVQWRATIFAIAACLLCAVITPAHGTTTTATPAAIPRATPTPRPRPTPPPRAISQIPRGVFCLQPVGQGTGPDPFVYSDPDVDGISVRQNWGDLELTEGIFDWSYLDSVTAMAAAAGKKVLLRIGTGGGDIARGGSCPTWVMDAVALEPLPPSQKFYAFNDNGRPVTIAVFWDSVWLAKKTAMITALGARYASNPAVKIVGASFANANSEDWAVPHTPPEVAAWFAAGYTSAKMLDAGRQIIDVTMAAFPNQYITLAVAGNGPTLDPDPSYVARNAVLNARASWPGRLIVQKNSLGTFIPTAPGIGTPWELMWNSRPDVAGQLVYWCYGDPTYRVNHGVPIDPSTALVNSVNKGLGYGMKYIEIYRKDVTHLLSATHYAHTVLTSP